MTISQMLLETGAAPLSDHRTTLSPAAEAFAQVSSMTNTRRAYRADWQDFTN